MDFWGIWCKPCLVQHEEIKNLQSAFDSGLQIVALNYKDKRSRWISYIEDNNYGWTHGQVSQETIVSLQIFKFPYLVLLDSEGQLLCADCSMEEITNFINEKTN
jgi:thiol-disulfide isomerase/thioredoxin